jgi:exosortase/archaeosortase family protein
VRGLSLDTPLAYLGLVPFIALGLALARGLAPRLEPDIHDRYVDYIIGVPFLLAALTIVLILPVHASTFFWLWRLDLLSMPFFAAGGLAIVFGVRALWRMKLPIAFLFLAWPPPYLTLLNDWLRGFTDLTITAVKALLEIVPVAVPANRYDGSVFTVGQGAQAFVVSIASACAGVNGLVGFVLVGVAFAAVVRGRFLPKLAWLVGGMALLYAINLARILAIFAVGQQWGEGVAIDSLHPVIGLVAFNLGVLVMILAMPLFRLRIGAVGRSGPATTIPPRPRRLAVDRVGVAFVVVLVAASLAGTANVGMQQFELLANDLGTPRVGELTLADVQVPGWSLSPTDSFPWVSRYFGDGGSWTRYTYDYQAQAPNPSPFRASVPVVLDVISTSDLNSFSAYGLQACYRFHNYQILDAHRVDLAGGVTGQSVVYYIPNDQTNWLAVFWEWPVSASGQQRYERVVVNMIDPGGDQVSAPRLSATVTASAGLVISDWFGQTQSTPLAPQLASARDFLVGFSQEIVKAAAAHSGEQAGRGGGASG